MQNKLKKLIAERKADIKEMQKELDKDKEVMTVPYDIGYDEGYINATDYFIKLLTKLIK